MLHMLQMKRPQSEHGYPSDARSSFAHARHTMASRSRSSAISTPGIARAVSGRAR